MDVILLLLHGVVLHLLDLEVPEGAVARDSAEHDDGEGAAHGDGGGLVPVGGAVRGAHELCKERQTTVREQLRRALCLYSTPSIRLCPVRPLALPGAISLISALRPKKKNNDVHHQKKTNI